MLDASVIILAYLLGSFASAIVFAKLFNLPDPTQVGSGNPGATNMLRIGGKKIAILVLFVDAFKGYLAVSAAKFLLVSDLVMSLVALAALLGHMYPLFFRFQGGKGVATAFGVILSLSLPAGLLVLATWCVTAFVTGYSSLAALVTSVLSIVYIRHFLPIIDLPAFLCMVALLFWRHRANIHRLIIGTEPTLYKAESRDSPRH